MIVADQIRCHAGRHFAIERHLSVYSADGKPRNFGIYLVREEQRTNGVALDGHFVLKVPNMAHRQYREAIIHSFQRERDVLIALDRQPHIVELLNHGTLDLPDDPPFLALGYIDGENLSQLSAPPRTLSLAQMLAVAEQIALALGHLHAQDIYHGDLKPSNIMLDFSQRRVVLIDFGSAWRPSHGNPLSPGITARYAAPEQLDDGDWDATTDLHALAAVLFELLTGRPLFPGRTIETIRDERAEKLPPAREGVVQALRPHAGACSELLADVLLGCVRERQADRAYPTAAALFEALCAASASITPEHRGRSR